MTDDGKEVRVMQHTEFDLRLVREHRQRQIDEAAEHRRAFATIRRPDRRPFRRAVGRSLVRLGNALANDHDGALQSARPR